MGNNAKPPVEFYQPQSNAQDLLTVFKAFVDLSDDVSAIPKYIGGQASGGAGRTASGLAMLMGNASKILQTVAANIDRDVFEVALQQLADLVLLSDTTGLLTGEEDIYVQGVSVAVQRETQRQRQLEFLQHTNNPVDMGIMGIKGRGAVLRSVSQTIGLDGDEVVPSDDELVKKEQAQKEEAGKQAINQRVDQGIQQGVQSGVQKISTELSRRCWLSRRWLAMQGGQPGTGGPPGAAGSRWAPQPPGGPPGPGGPMDRPPRRRRVTSRRRCRTRPRSGANVVGNQPKPPGPGGRPPPIGGGPG